jgi:hypothetical protein
MERGLTSLYASRPESANAPGGVFKMRQEALSSVTSEGLAEAAATSIINEKSVDMSVVQI